MLQTRKNNQLRTTTSNPLQKDLAVQNYFSPTLLQLAILVALGFSVSHFDAEATAQPNIVYILADDLGYGDLSCYGQEKFNTPNIDRLAAEGIRFTQHYAGSAVCAPSRSCIVTGLHTGHTPIRGNTEIRPEGQATLPSDTFTLPKWLKANGYATGVFGKWGLGAPNSDGEPLRQGFDRFYGFNCQRQAHHYYPYFLWNDRQREMLWDNFGLERGTYAPELIQREAVEFIEAQQNGPFFLFYAHIVPHAEMFAPESYLARFRGKFGEEKPYVGVDEGPLFRKASYGSQAEPRAAFAAMVTLLDDHVGEIVDKLDELGIADNTLIVFSSDNGPHQEAGHDPNYFNSSGGLRGYKRDLYEGGIRMPLVARWPNAISPGTTSDHICAQWDLLPTFSDVANCPVDKELDGLSFAPTLTGKGEQPTHDHLYWEFHEARGRQAVRRGKWKAVRYNVSSQPSATPELYDLDADPTESTNLATQHPDITSELAELMATSRTASDNPKFNFPKSRRR